MSQPLDAANSSTIQAAVEAYRRGFQPLPVKHGSKAPMGSGWTHTQWDSEEQVRASFEKFPDSGAPNLGLLLGKRSGGLVDVDLDHVSALNLRKHFIPPTRMITGRAGRPRSHCWFIAEGDIPATRQYKLPDGQMLIELRSNGSQTVIPPSTWYPPGWKGEEEFTQKYRWESSAWGGKNGPTRVNGRMLSIQVALTGLGALLLGVWPKQGGRHEAYLALAGGLMRLGDSIHPYWERNLPVLIQALADATHDEDGPEQRVKEVMGTTLTRLEGGGKATGLTRLSEIIGSDYAEQTRRYAREIEALAGFVGHEPTRMGDAPAPMPPLIEEEEELVSTLPPAKRDPMGERVTTWAAVDLEPYIAGEVEELVPTILTRTDGKSLFYAGMVNSLFGPSESGKTWVSLYACVQEMGKGERVMVLDFEDSPMTALKRLRLLGAGDDDLRHRFRYVHPEEPISPMQRYKYGDKPTERGLRSFQMFRSQLEEFDPTLVVVDGLTMLYGLHGHDTNDATGTDIVTSWLKSLARGGRTAVLPIDHTGKNAGAGSSAVGSQHKQAMVQGSMIRVDTLSRPLPGAKGLMDLIVFKDRHGTVRGYSSNPGQKEQVGGQFVMDSRDPEMVKVTIEPADPDDVVVGGTPEAEKKLIQLSIAEEKESEVLDMFGADPSKYLKTAEVIKALNLERDVVYLIWEALERDGKVVREGQTRWTRFRLAREDEAK